ncbi:MAG TPA: tetratricopeptide repeat protein [Terriglobales bacterium]|nr:tetratricopeptide repeat protein [Terriglobales bacterium]
MNPRLFKAIALGLIPMLFDVSVLAQRGSTPNAGVVTNPVITDGRLPVDSNGTILQLAVHDDEKRKPLDRQALVQLTNKTTGQMQAQVTQDGSMATIANLEMGAYDVAVSALGYLTSHQEIMISGSIITNHMEVALKKDPSAIDLGAVNAKEMPTKVRRNMLHGLAALKSSKFDEAQKKLDAAYSSDPSNPEVNFLLGYLYFAKGDMERAQSYLAAATRLAPHNVQALNLLGRVQLRRNDAAAALGPLEQAIATDPDSWMAHYLLADAYLQQRDFDKAQVQAQLAIERGTSTANAAQLILGQALANLKRYPQAIQALETFMNGAPTDAHASQVHLLVAELEKRQSQVPDDAGTMESLTAAAVTEPIIAATDPGVTMKSWGPPGVEDAKPQVASGVSCPTEEVIRQAGERVKELVDDLAKFDAVEDVYHEEVDQLGMPKKHTTVRFDYVASIAEPKPGRFKVEEYRSGRSGTEDFPDQIATRGLPTLAFIFHPDMRDDFELSCEGLGTWNEKATWLVHFQQRAEKPHRIQAYIVNGIEHDISLKGRAWVSADTFQIIRLETDLMAPVKEIQLLSEHQTVEYAPVRFPKSKAQLWLPKNAELYFDFRKHRYFRRHSFDHFMLFSVDTEEKRKEPKEAKIPESRSPKSKSRKRHA